MQSYSLALSAPASDYAARLLALAPMQAWYEAALAGTWRDEAHEAETRAVGARGRPREWRAAQVRTAT